MIRELTESIFISDADALVVPANCEGVAGAGLAAQFKKRFPEQYESYRSTCKTGGLSPGEVIHTYNMNGPDIIWAATKEFWRNPSKYGWTAVACYNIEQMVKDLDTIDGRPYKRVAVPALGCGLGKLRWEYVRRFMYDWFEGSRIDYDIYPPQTS